MESEWTVITRHHVREITDKKGNLDILLSLNTLASEIYKLMYNENKPLSASYITHCINNKLETNYTKNDIGDCLYDILLGYVNKRKSFNSRVNFNVWFITV